jgi:hypothetical protein
VTMKNAMFLDVAPCNLVLCCLFLLVSCLAYSSTEKTEAMWYSATSDFPKLVNVTTQKTVLYNLYGRFRGKHCLHLQGRKAGSDVSMEKNRSRCLCLVLSEIISRPVSELRLYTRLALLSDCGSLFGLL